MRQRQPPPALRNSLTSQPTTVKPHASSWRPTRGGTAGITTLRPDHDRVGAEGEGLLVGQPQRLGHERLDHRRAVAVPAHRRRQGPPVVERAERDVEVVQPLVDQLDRAHTAPASEPGQVRWPPAVAAEPVARRAARRRTGSASPAPSWSRSAGSRSTVQAVLGEPGGEVLGLGLPLGVAEVRGDELRSGGRRALTMPALAVNTMSGTSGGWAMSSTSAPASRRVATEPLPLRPGPVDVDAHLGVHPRVDLVEDAEVGRRAHQEAPAPGEAGHRRPLSPPTARRARRRAGGGTGRRR